MKKLQWITLGLVIIAVAIAVAVLLKPPVALCRDTNCDNFRHEDSQILVKHYDDDDGVIYVYILERRR
jgi:hypothetical protein